MSTSLRTTHKAVAIGATAALALSLSACSGSSDSSEGGEDAITIGFVNGSNTEFHTCLQAAIEEQAAEEGAEIITANSKQDPGTELANIEDMLSRNVDLLMVQTVNVDALANDIARAKAADVPIFLTSVLPEDLSGVLGAQIVPLAEVGKLDAEWVAEDAAGKPVEAAVIAGAPGAASDVLVGGFTDALPENVEVVANQPGMFNRSKAQEVAENIISSHPDLGYAFVANEDMAFGAANAFKAAGKDVKIVTSNGTDAGLEALQNGTFSAIVSNSALITGHQAVQHALDLLEDPRGSERIGKTPIELITKENAADAPRYCAAE
ncbi:MAG: sugar ABC transporter substrate-binding protein [Actinomycetota bacterium]|nr:sugar ABC transporter substrate-binding protein [Actinomycetota bacterium]